VITFLEAMLITQGDVEGEWEQGTLHILPAGLEDKTHYVVSFGAREWIVDGNPAFMFGDIPLAFVNKEDGECIFKAQNVRVGPARQDDQGGAHQSEIAQFAEEAAK